MNKKISLGVAITIVVLAIAVTASVTAMISLNAFDTLVYNITGKEDVYEKIREMESTIKKNFYGDPDEQALQDALAAGFIAGLDDPYSVYLSADEYQKKKLSNTGVRVGIGVTLQLDESGYAKIIKLNEEGAAAKAGIAQNDLIVAIDGDSVLQKSLNEITDLVSGKEGTEVVITIRRADENVDYTVIRSSFDIETVTYQMMGSIAYVKVNGFNGKTVEQFQNALKYIEKHSAKGIVFDLRNNGGGLLTSACQCLDMLVGEGTLVTAEYNNGETKVLHTSDKDEINLPMVVLQNGNTASAGELFSATLRDFGKASIVGSKSFGKGVMQSLYELSDGSAINITTAKFAPYSGTSFNKIGIAPTYEVSVTKEQEQMILFGDLNDDPQLSKALEVLGAKK